MFSELQSTRRLRRITFSLAFSILFVLCGLVSFHPYLHYVLFSCKLDKQAGYVSFGEAADNL